MAKTSLLGLGKKGGDTCWGEANHSAGNDAEETYKSDGTSEVGGKRPEGEEEYGGDEGGREVDVEGAVASERQRVLAEVIWFREKTGEALLVGEISSKDATDCAAPVRNAQEVKGSEPISPRQHPTAASDILFDTDAFPLRPAFEVEEDGIEAEKDETHGRNEPGVWAVVKCCLVDPDFELQPLLGHSQRCVWVWSCA